MKPIAYGPECCLDTAASALEKIFQKKVDHPPGRVFNPGVTATTNQKVSLPPFGGNTERQPHRLTQTRSSRQMSQSGRKP